MNQLSYMYVIGGTTKIVAIVTRNLSPHAPPVRSKYMYSMSQKKVPFYSRFNRSGPFRSVLTVYRGQTVLALGMNSSAKFTACVGEA